MFARRATRSHESPTLCNRRRRIGAVVERASCPTHLAIMLMDVQVPHGRAGRALRAGADGQLIQVQVPAGVGRARCSACGCRRRRRRRAPSRRAAAVHAGGGRAPATRAAGQPPPAPRRRRRSRRRWHMARGGEAAAPRRDGARARRRRPAARRGHQTPSATARAAPASAAAGGRKAGQDVLLPGRDGDGARRRALRCLRRIAPASTA